MIQDMAKQPGDALSKVPAVTDFQDKIAACARPGTIIFNVKQMSDFLDAVIRFINTSNSAMAYERFFNSLNSKQYRQHVLSKPIPPRSGPLHWRKPEDRV
jgi:hypothetical protein